MNKYNKRGYCIVHFYLSLYFGNRPAGGDKGGEGRKNKPHVRTFYLGVAESEGECRLG